ncbi:hypothetical protein QM565_26490, partial [Geitlerinema splendidum]|nr:hypothetical protein [Geitlerinema splendidum]
GGWGEKDKSAIVLYTSFRTQHLLPHSALSTQKPTQHSETHSALSTLHSALREAPSSGWGKSTVRAIAILLKLSLG